MILLRTSSNNYAIKTGFQQYEGATYYFGSDVERGSDGSLRKHLKGGGTLLTEWHEIDNKNISSKAVAK